MLFVLALALWFAGCTPISDTQPDETRDPHYMAGKTRMGSRNFPGAAEAFEKALEANPRNSLAHFHLGLLYENASLLPNQFNYARAIYHYEEHLRLRPDSNLKNTINQKILACKVELAKDVQFQLVPRPLQEELDRLNTTNNVLRLQVEQLKAEVAQLNVFLSNRANAAPQLQAQPQPQAQAPQPVETVRPQPNNAITPSARPQETARSATRTADPGRRPVTPTTTQTRQAARPSRTYTIRSGDTMASIARSYGIPVSRLQAANPGIDPRRMIPGRSMAIPSP